MIVIHTVLAFLRSIPFNGSLSSLSPTSNSSNNSSNIHSSRSNNSRLPTSQHLGSRRRRRRRSLQGLKRRTQLTQTAEDPAMVVP